jgi:hypothetical protein
VLGELSAADVNRLVGPKGHGDRDILDIVVSAGVDLVASGCLGSI